MDTETIVIGSNTRYGRALPQPQPQSNTKKGDGKVEVYANGVFLKQIPFRLLVRFSKAASAVFAKNTDDKKEKEEKEDKREKEEKGDAEGKKADQIGEKKGSVDWAEDDGEDPQLPQPDKQPKGDTASAGGSAHKLGKQQINFYLDTLFLQPPPEAFDFAFKWMDVVKNVGRGAPVLDYGVTNSDDLSLHQLVDLYAVALVLDLRPACHKHRFELLTRITEERPTPATLKYVHEHLPLKDVAVTRFITSYYEHRDRPGSIYTPDELKEIEDYVCTVDYDLHARFLEIGESRAQKQKYSARRRGEAKMQRATRQYLNGDTQGGAAEAVGAESVVGAGAGAWEQKKGGKSRREGSNK